jgi:hypothetical protein
VVTEAGDPSVDPDTIYARAVDPADYRGEDVVILLDDAIMRVDAGGQTSYTIRQVGHVLTADGARSLGELAFGYYPKRQRFRLNWLRVLRPDGTVLSDGPEHRQESSTSVGEGSHLRSDQRIVQIAVGGVAPGTLLDYSYTLETFDPRLPGDVWYAFGVNALVPILHSRVILDMPEGLTLRVRDWNIDAPPLQRLVDGRKVLMWVSRDLPAVEPESYWGSPNDVFTTIRISGDLTWDQIGRWYHSLIEDRYVSSPEIEAEHTAQLTSARSIEDSLRATYRWVAQDFRYVSLPLGDGAYQPRTPLQVMASGFGDCKDKTTLFVTLARKMGVEAYPVLVSSEGGLDSLAPSLKQLDHMIATVEGPDGPKYLDLTTALAPYGELPIALQGEAGVVLRDGRETEVVVLPAASTEANLFEQSIVGTLSRDNRFTGSLTLTALGSWQYGMRGDFSSYDQLGDDERDGLIRSYLNSASWDGAEVDSSHAFEGRDLATPARVTIWFTVPDILGEVGDRYLLNLPLGVYGDRSLLTQLESEGERQFPIDVASVNDASIHRSRFEVELPDGWRADLPEDVSVRGTFGYYLGDYRQVGRTVSIVREMGGRRGLEPPDSIGALKAWIRAVAEDDAVSVTLDRSGSRGLIAPGTVAEVGRLPDVVLSVDDLPGGATLADEGPTSPDFLQEFAGGEVLEAFSRTFAAEQMVFTVGGSQLLYLELGAQVYNSNVEASKALMWLELFDMRALLQAYISQMGMAQVSMGEMREIDLSSITDHAAGWMMEMVTPFATMDLALTFLSRGRVAFSGAALGVAGMQGDDLAGLLAIMDERVRADAEYLNDFDPSPSTSGEEDEDLSVAANVGVALDEVLLHPVDVPGSRLGERSLVRNDGVPVYSRTLEGRAFTFSTGNSEAIVVEMEVAQYENEAYALKALLDFERLDFEAYVRSAMGDEQAIADLVLGGGDSSFEHIEAQTIGTRSIQWLARMRGGIRIDTDVIHFIRGRYLVTLSAASVPGQSSPEDAQALARRIDERLVGVVPELVGAAPPSRDLVDAVRAVVVAEAEIDSLTVVARDFEPAFLAIQRADLSEAPVTFGPDTWNGICWFASIHGHAERVLYACDLAVAPDSTNVNRRDSRAVARALTGNVEGAIADLQYVVENAAEGPFLEIRADWLAALESGVNPFTEAELERLQGIP